MVNWENEIYALDDLELLIMRILLSVKKPLNVNQIYQRVTVSQYLKLIDNSKLDYIIGQISFVEEKGNKTFLEYVEKYAKFEDKKESSNFMRWLLIYMKERETCYNQDSHGGRSEYREIHFQDNDEYIESAMSSEVESITNMLSFKSTESIREILKKHKIKVVSFNRIKTCLNNLVTQTYVCSKTIDEEDYSFHVNPQTVLHEGSNWKKVFFSLAGERYNLDGFLW